MPLQLSDLMLRLQPTPAMPSFAGGDSSQLEMEKQRLQLMQQEFENTKAHQQQELELQRMAQAGAMAREQLTNQRLAQQAAAATQAKALEDRQKAFDDLAKYRDAGDYEGMAMAAVKLNDLGGVADRLGQDANGLPTYQVALDADKFHGEQQGLARQVAPGTGPGGGDESAAQSLNRLGALGHDLTAGSSLAAETSPGMAAPLSTEDAFSQAQAARRQEAATGQPAAAPAPADFMGGVPKGVIDTGAMNAQAQQRLGPVMSAIQQSYPGAYQDSVGKTNEAVTGLALPPGKSLEAMKALRAGPDAAIEKQLSEDAALQRQREKEADKSLKPIERQRLINYGVEGARKSFADEGIKAHIEAMQSADLVRNLLDDDKPENDDYAINLLMQLDKNRGAQSEHDAERVTGLTASSTPDQIKAWLYKHINGGTYGPIKEAMKSFAEHLRDQSREAAFSWIDTQQGLADQADHPLVGKGTRDYVKTLPSWLLKEYEDAYPQEAQPSGSAAPASPSGAPPAGGAAPVRAGTLTSNHDFMETLSAESAQHDVNENNILKIIMPESHGDPQAVNQKGSGAEGLLQMLPSIARSYTNPHTGKPFSGSHELAQLPAAEQAPFIVKYFADRGITSKSPPEDYALAVAAPDYIGKPRSTVIAQYQDAKTREQNPGWIPRDGGPITVGSVLDFYGFHGSNGPARASHPAAPRAATTAQAGRDDARLLEGI